jgi:hypothetical protein
LVIDGINESSLGDDSMFHSSSLHTTNDDSTDQITNVLASMVVSGSRLNQSQTHDNVTVILESYYHSFYVQTTSTFGKKQQYFWRHRN